MRKIISVLLAVIMALGVLTIAPFTVSAATYGDYEYRLEDDYTCTITKYNGSATNVTIPSTIYGNKVTTIGTTAFYKNKYIVSVKIPNGINKIKASAFGDCPKLKTIELPTYMKEIEGSAFANSAIEFLNLPNGITYIGSMLFLKCQNLKSVKIPNTVLTLDGNCFYNCTSLENISLPDSVKYFNSPDIFNSCTNLKNVEIGSGLVPKSYYSFSSVTIGVGETYTISESTNSGSYANASNLKWSTSNSSVATVTKGSGNKATVTAKGVGTAYVKITLYNGKTAQCKVTVKPAPTSVKSYPASVTLGKGENYTIAAGTNSGSWSTTYTWSSSNNSVATVTGTTANKAKITAKGTGTATITIRTFNGKTATCKVTVKNAPASVKVNPSSITLKNGASYTISESTNSGTYANADNLKWSTSNSSVATVTKGNGNKATITAKAKGTAYIKITLYNGKTAQCKVTVK